jgi:hypothetical protein
MARTVGLPALLGPACRARDLADGLIASRVFAPDSKLCTLRGCATSPGADLGITCAGSDDVYTAMDWLYE